MHCAIRVGEHQRATRRGKDSCPAATTEVGEGWGQIVAVGCAEGRLDYLRALTLNTLFGLYLPR